MSSTTTTRLVLCHSWYTEQESRGQAMFLIRWFLLPMIRPVLDNMRETELWLESECDKKINWTVVRPAGLTNSALSDKEFKVEMDKFDVSLKSLGSLVIFQSTLFEGLQRGREDCQSRRGAVHVVLHLRGEISPERSGCCSLSLVCPATSIHTTLHHTEYVINCELNHANIYIVLPRNAPGCCILTF